MPFETNLEKYMTHLHKVVKGMSYLCELEEFLLALHLQTSAGRK